MAGQPTSPLKLTAGITVVSGLGGSGKSSCCASLVIAAVEAGMPVLTNLNLNLGTLSRDYPDARELVTQFIVPILELDGKCIVGGEHPNDGFLMDGNRLAQMSGGLVIIDEAQEWFPSKGFGQKDPRGESVNKALQRFRHSGLSIVFVTPSASGKGLWSQILDKAQQHVHCVNIGRGPKFLGLFSMPEERVARVYGGGKIDRNNLVETYHLDVKLAGRYYHSTGGTYGREPIRSSDREIKEGIAARFAGRARWIALVAVWIAAIWYTGSRVSQGIKAASPRRQDSTGFVLPSQGGTPGAVNPSALTAEQRRDLAELLGREMTRDGSAEIPIGLELVQRIRVSATAGELRVWRFRDQELEEIVPFSTPERPPYAFWSTK